MKHYETPKYTFLSNLQHTFYYLATACYLLEITRETNTHAHAHTHAYVFLSKCVSSFRHVFPVKEEFVSPLFVNIDHCLSRRMYECMYCTPEYTFILNLYRVGI